MNYEYQLFSGNNYAMLKSDLNSHEKYGWKFVTVAFLG